jgi:oligopeptide transport system permease protein
MTAATTTPTHLPPAEGSLTEPLPPASDAPPGAWRRSLKSGRVLVGGGILLVIVLICILTLPWTTKDDGPLYYDLQNSALSRHPPASGVAAWFGFDTLGRSMLGRSLLGGTISLAIGVLAALLSVFLGVTVGLLAGFRGGWTDSILMRLVDILYGLPYILLVILFKIALEQPLTRFIRWSTDMRGAEQVANFVVLFFAIGAVSWLTMARVVRGQVLSLRAQPFIEACKAAGLPEWRIFTRHLLPNLMGPITVYATLIVPSAILNESFLSFLGIGIQPPVPTWGALAAEGLLPALNPANHRWWMLVFPCTLLAVTLLSLNFVGDGLRDVFDPKRDSAKL